VYVYAAAFMLPALLAAQSPAPPSSAVERPRFDAASVKPNTSPDAGINNRISPGRFTYVNTPLAVLIEMAYSMPSERVLNVPDWARSAKFDVTATYNAEYRAFSPQERAMLQRLLEERFALQTHRETREMPVYELARVRPDGELGPRLRASTVDCSPTGTADRTQCGTRINLGVIQGKAVDWRMLTGQLPSAVGRTVIDKTGLQGYFDVTLEWIPDPAVVSSPDVAALAAGIAATPGERVSIFTALQEQLGLKLEPARAPLDVLVIDRVERPTPD
jgi:uncharacterized protein (TIGR03435 family)